MQLTRQILDSSNFNCATNPAESDTQKCVQLTRQNPTPKCVQLTRQNPTPKMCATNQKSQKFPASGRVPKGPPLLTRVSSTFFKTPPLGLVCSVFVRLTVIHHILGAKFSTLPRKKNRRHRKNLLLFRKLRKVSLKVSFE